jgi:hypothetical protein
MVLGDYIPEFSDVVWPRINIAQNIGDLGETFDPGAIVLGKQSLLFSPPIISKEGVVTKPALPPITIVVLGFRPTKFCEKTDWGFQGLIVNTEAEVRAAGGTLDYKEWELKKASGMKRFEPLADAFVAIERPDHLKDDDTVFVFPADGKKYALALWALRGSSYTVAAKAVFFTQRKIGALRSGYPTMSFSCTTRLKEFGAKKSAWVPICVGKEKSSPAFLNFVADILGAPATALPSPTVAPELPAPAAAAPSTPAATNAADVKSSSPVLVTTGQ